MQYLQIKKSVCICIFNEGIHILQSRTSGKLIKLPIAADIREV